MIRRWNPDIVHAHLHEGVLIARIMQLIFFWKKLPVVADFHGSLVGEMRSHGYLQIPPLGTIFRFVERTINAMGDRAIVSGEENIKVIESARRDHQVSYIFDGVNLSEYARLTCDKKSYRKKYNVPENALVVVYTGALISNKGIDHVMGAIMSAIAKMPDVHFVIGGYPDELIRQFVKKNCLEHKVTIISPLSYFDLPVVNYMSDVAIDPKDADVRQASGKMLQYMAAHTGIICSRRPTNIYYLGEDSAIFLENVTSDAIVSAIERYYTDRAYLSHCAASAYARVQKFDWEVIGEKIEHVYEDVLKDK